jgi:hypothetical protein
LETRNSGEYRIEDGQLKRSKKAFAVRGLNKNHNHDVKNMFKGAAVIAASKPGPFQEFYAALLAKGMRPEMARLTLARKIATIVLIVWKKGVCLCAGINRHEVENARVLRERTSDSPGPEFCAAHREVHSEA